VQKHTILIVDDEQIVRQSIVEALEDEDYNLIFAENGKIGIESFKKNNPILTILDLKMPIMDGYEFLDNIKLSPAGSSAVIVLTGHGADEDVSRCYNLGISNFIHKPFNIYELLGTVKQTISLKITQNELVKEISEKEKTQEELYNHYDKLEELVNLRTNALQKAKNRYRNLILYTPYALVVARESHIVFANPAFAALVGSQDYNQLIGRPVNDFLDISLNNLDDTKISESVPSINPVNKKMITMTGEMLEVELSIIPTVYENQPAIQLIVNDITKRMELEAQLRRAQKLESVGLLAGGIAHDFGNILTGIVGYAEMILYKISDDSPDRAFIEAIVSKADEASVLIRQILSYGSKLILDIKLMDLNCTVYHASEFIGKILKDNISIDIDLAEKLDAINADEIGIQQIITNLCVNAQDALPKGGYIFISTSNVVLTESFCEINLDANPGSFVLLTIRDTGIGMEKDVLSKIFNIFFTTKSESGGTGLGLSMVHGLVKQHNGFIQCESQPEKGTTFYIYFPVSVTLDKDEDSSTEVFIPDHGSESILLVEDDLDVLLLIKGVLEKSGYSVHTTKNGLEALDFLNNKDESLNIDLVISDISMPKLDGLELRKRLPELDFLLISGFQNSVPVKLENCAKTFFLPKPFTMKQLKRKVRQLLIDD